YGSPLFQSTLLTYDKEFNIEKDLAVDYQVSDDGLEWIVTIRDDVIFTDGEPLTAEDIVFTYKTAKTSHSVIDLTNKDKVEKVELRTVKFTLRKRYSTYIYTLTNNDIVHTQASDY